MQIFRLSTARVKIHQVSHVIFQTKSQFFFKLWLTLQWHVRSFFRSFLAKTLYAIGKSSTRRCKFSDVPLVALKFTKFLMSFLEPIVSFLSNFASLFSVMRHNSSVVFRLNLYMLWTKRAHQCTIFQTFECSNESSPNSSCNFRNYNVRVYSNFASMFIVMKNNSSVFFALNLIYIGQKEPIEKKFSDFCVVGLKFLMSYLKPQVILSINFASPFSVMKDNSSVLFQLQLCMIWTKGAHQSAKCQTFNCSREGSPNLYFHRLLLLRVYKISP